MIEELSKKVCGLVEERVRSQVRLEDEIEMCLGALFCSGAQEFSTQVFNPQN